MAINFNQLRTLTGHFQESAGTAGQIELSTGFAGNALTMVAGGSLGLDISAARPAQTFAVGGGAWTFGADELLVTGTPTAANSIPNKLYVDNLISGVNWKNPVFSPESFVVDNNEAIAITFGALTNGDTISYSGIGAGLVTFSYVFTYQAVPVAATDFSTLTELSTAINTATANAGASQVLTTLQSIAAETLIITVSYPENRIWSSTAGVQFIDFSGTKSYDKTSADLVSILVDPVTDNFGERIIASPGQARLSLSTDKQYVYDADTTAWVLFDTGSLIAGNGISIVGGAVSIAAAGVVNGMMAIDSISTNNIIALNVTAAKLAVDSVITSKILNANVTPAKLSFSWKSETILSSVGTFSLGFTTLTIVGAAPSADAALSQGFMLMRNGIDDMTQVTVAPTTAAQWQIVGGTINLFGDQTLSGDSYKIRYMA